MFLIVISLSAAIAMAFDEPKLAAIVPALALPLFLNGAGAQIRVQLSRRLKFGVLAVSSSVSQITGVIVAIVMASGGMGYWALVGQTIVASGTCVILEALALKWVPSRYARGHRTNAIVRTGFNYFLNQIFAFIQGHTASFILGVQFGATRLGAYSRASTIVNLPMGGILGPLMRVVIPILNRAKEEDRSTGLIFARIQVVVGLFFVAALASAAGSGAALVEILLGPGWEDSVAILRILALGASFEVLNNICFWAFVHYGLSAEFVVYNLVSKPIMVLGLSLGSIFGMEGAAVGFVIAQAVSWPLNFVWLRNVPWFPVRRLLLDGVALSCTACIAALFGLLATNSVDQLWLELLVGVSVSAIAFMSGCFLFPSIRRSALRDLGLLINAIGSKSG